MLVVFSAGGEKLAAMWNQFALAVEGEIICMNHPVEQIGRAVNSCQLSEPHMWQEAVRTTLNTEK